MPREITDEQFLQCLGVLESACGKRFTDPDVDVWFGLLGHLPTAVLMTACKRFAIEGDGFPTVAKINKLAGETQHGIIDTQGDTFARVAEAVRRFGPCLPCDPKCDKCRADIARKYIGEVGWRAVQAVGGWTTVCNTNSDQISTLRAQYRDAFRAAAERESQRRLLPEQLQPRIDNGTPPELPEPTPAGLKLITDAAAGLKSVEEESPRPMRSVIRRTKP